MFYGVHHTWMLCVLNVNVISDVIRNNRIYVYHTPDFAQKQLKSPKRQDVKIELILHETIKAS